MTATFQGLIVLLLAVFPGALYTFSYERLAGSFTIAASDRVVRFIGASGVFLAVFSGPLYVIYSHYLRNGSFAAGQTNPLVLESFAILYIAVPIAVGSIIGAGQTRIGKRWAWTRWFGTVAPEPRAWDHLWRRRPHAVIRMRMKSGTWLAGYFGAFDGRDAYASAYPEAGDLFLSAAFIIDPSTGELKQNDDGTPCPVAGRGGLLVHWDDIEYLEVLEG